MIRKTKIDRDAEDGDDAEAGADPNRHETTKSKLRPMTKMSRMMVLRPGLSTKPMTKSPEILEAGDGVAVGADVAVAEAAAERISIPIRTRGHAAVTKTTTNRSQLNRHSMTITKTTKRSK